MSTTGDKSPDYEELTRFAAGELDDGEGGRLVSSLLAAPATEEAGDRDPLGFPWRSEEGRYDVAWKAACGRTLDLSSLTQEEPRKNLDLLEELLRQPAPRRRLRICQDKLFHSWALCEALLESSHRACFQRPVEALELAELAVSVAAELSEDLRTAELLVDLKARAWALLGNARRVSSDLRGAEKAFELAESLLERGSGDPFEVGRFFELKASLCIDSNRWQEADHLLRLASRLYRRMDCRHRQGRCLISRAGLFGRQEEPERALRLLRQGLECIDECQEPRLRLVALHNLCYYLGETGNLDEARELLGEAKELHGRLGNSLDGVRLRWLEGRLALVAGDLTGAEEAFVETREAFVREEIGYDAALVSLELAGVFARQGRAAEMRRLAEEILPIFQSRDLGREVMAALIVLQNASHMENASVGLIDELSTLLKASRDESDSQLRP